ncbi:MAG: hypothetical protein R3293_28180 [Candidatus Promineifilaceae bacterium]|nr:hypothetical protein [Candidatus Promineifilaceae bacterium]
MLPNAPACKCDMCGHTQFDDGFLLTMQILLEKLTDKERQDERKKQPVADPPMDWSPVRRGG